MSASFPESVVMRNLTVGDRGPEVGYLQRLLNYENLMNGLAEPELREDCSFGPRTLARLQCINGGTANLKARWSTA